MFSKLIAKVVGAKHDKQRWWRYKARKEQLPPNYRAALDAVQRYTYVRGPGTADASMSLLEDLADVFEQAAANGTPIRDIVGGDPVEFAEGFIRNYEDKSWVHKERERLTRAVEEAAGEDAGTEGRTD
jgi:DNA-binding ferritin-like protein (Dps family)